MNETTLRLRDAITVSETPGLSSPLNLSFAVKALPAAFEKSLVGTGIYVISHNEQVVYIGKYQPLTKGMIFNDRWLRHLETITLRGRRVGFGGTKDSACRLKQLLLQVTNASLKLALTNIHEADATLRFRDTGVTTSKNRVGFADENWSTFGAYNDFSILAGFEIRLLRFSRLASQVVASAAASKVEKAVLAEFKPRCNKEFSLAKHDSLRSSNTVPTTVARIRALAQDSAAAEIEACAALVRS